MKNKTTRFFAWVLILAMLLPMAVSVAPVSAEETVKPDPISGMMAWDFSDAA